MKQFIRDFLTAILRLICGGILLATTLLPIIIAIVATNPWYLMLYIVVPMMIGIEILCIRVILALTKK